jgi:transposase
VTLRRVLVEISVTEQRYQAVLDVHAGSTVTDVAARLGVSRQAVHRWLTWYQQEGLAGLADRSSRPRSSPTQTSAELEALICELRRNHRWWGARRVLFELGRMGCPGPLPSRITVHRILVRHGLVDERPRRRRREDYLAEGPGADHHLVDAQQRHRGARDDRAGQRLSRPGRRDARKLVTCLGLTLMVPTVVGLVGLALVVAANDLLVRLVEEPHLRRVHGEVYARYAAAVGRFVPGVGRLGEPGSRR